MRHVIEHAGVVHQDVDRAEVKGHVADHVRHLFGLRDVRLNKMAACAGIDHGEGCFFRLASLRTKVNGHVGAGLGEEPAAFAANATRAAGDEGRFSREFSLLHRSHTCVNLVSRLLL